MTTAIWYRSHDHCLLLDLPCTLPAHGELSCIAFREGAPDCSRAITMARQAIRYPDFGETTGNSARDGGASGRLPWAKGAETCRGLDLLAHSQAPQGAAAAFPPPSGAGPAAWFPAVKRMVEGPPRRV